MLHLGLRGIRSLAVAKTNQDGKWEFLGLLTFLDPPRPDTKQTIEDANRYGVAVKMITGDHILIAKETARLCNIQNVDIVRNFYVLCLCSFKTNFHGRNRVLGMGNYIKSAAGLPLLDPVTKTKPEGLSRDYGDMCLAADGFAQVMFDRKTFWWIIFFEN